MIPLNSGGGSVTFCNQAGKSDDIHLPLFAATFLVLLSLVSAACAKVIHVSAGQITNASPDGMSWTNAFTDLQQGIDAASDGDEVWVAVGTYRPKIAILKVTMKEGVSVYGGFGGSSGGNRWSVPKNSLIPAT